MDQPLVSVCSITYNHAEYIETLINSVKDQTYRNIEHIVFDDCSTDGTRDVLESFNHPRLSLHYQEKNVGAGRNVDDCIKQARGEYIAILEGDDYYEPNKISSALQILRQPPSVDRGDIICTEIKAIWNDGRTMQHGWCGIGVAVPPILSYDELIKDNRIYTSTLVMKTEILKTAPGFSSFSQYAQPDYAMFLWLAKRYKICYIDEPLTVRRELPNSLSHNPAKLQEFVESYARIKADSTANRI